MGWMPLSEVASVLGLSETSGRKNVWLWIKNYENASGSDVELKGVRADSSNPYYVWADDVYEFQRYHANMIEDLIEKQKENS